MTTRTTYPSYRPSGIDWLGDIPSHWVIAQLNRVANESKLSNRSMEETTVLSLSYGRIVIKDTEKRGLMPENFNTYQIVNPGNIILRLTDLQNDQTSLRVGLAKNRGIITSAYVCLSPGSQVDSRYLYQLLHSFDEGKHLYGMGSGVRQGLSYKELRREPFPLPPLDEQRAIADYLDRKDDEITRFIESRRRMIALLEEKKQAIINQAVTRGLDPTVPMKDSGVEWLGEIPAHWEVVKLGRIINAASGGTPPMGRSEYWGGNVPWVSSKDMKHDRLSDSRDHITEQAKLSGTTGIAPKGALLMVVRSGILKHSIPTALVERELTFNQDIKRLTAKPNVVDMRWLQLLISGNQDAFLEQWRKQVATVESIELPWMMNTTVPLPPISEQANIAKRIDDIDRWMKDQQSRFDREIELMREYRTRLISDVVTGKVRVI